jgi:hypothetical protein
MLLQSVLNKRVAVLKLPHHIGINVILKVNPFVLLDIEPLEFLLNAVALESIRVQD